jgi:ribosomal protein L18E
MQDKLSIWLRSSFLILMLCSSSFLNAQHRDSIGLQEAVYRLNLALVMKNNKAIKKLVSKNIKYAHSNGWMETRKEMLKNLRNGTLTYKSIKLDKIETAIDKKMGLAKSSGKFVVIMKELELAFNLKVTQIWEWKRKKWVLMSRQSVKVD